MSLNDKSNLTVRRSECQELPRVEQNRITKRQWHESVTISQRHKHSIDWSGSYRYALYSRGEVLFEILW